MKKPHPISLETHHFVSLYVCFAIYIMPQRTKQYVSKERFPPSHPLQFTARQLDFIYCY